MTTIGYAAVTRGEVSIFDFEADATEDWMAPLKVPAADFLKNFSRYHDLALTQPVAIMRDGRERTVLVSAEEYARLKRRDRKVMSLADFTADDLEALEKTCPPEEAAAFDHEFKS